MAKLTLKDVIQVVRDTAGCKRFDTSSLKVSVEDFQLVVELIREAQDLGYFETAKEHVSSSTGLVDCVWVEGVTQDGEDYLNAA